jgi:hypothetical protein
MMMKKVNEEPLIIKSMRNLGNPQALNIQNRVVCIDGPVLFLDPQRIALEKTLSYQVNWKQN